MRACREVLRVDFLGHRVPGIGVHPSVHLHGARCPRLSWGATQSGATTTTDYTYDDITLLVELPRFSGPFSASIASLS